MQIWGRIRTQREKLSISNGSDNVRWYFVIKANFLAFPKWFSMITDDYWSLLIIINHYYSLVIITRHDQSLVVIKSLHRSLLAVINHYNLL